MTRDVISLQLSKAPQFTLSGLFRALPLLALCANTALLSASPTAAQDPADSSPPPGDVQSAPAPAPDTADHRKVISRDAISQPNQDQQVQQNPQDSQANDQPPQQRPNRRSGYAPSPAPSGPVPANLTIPAGKVLFIRLNEPLSSDRSHEGDAFTATLDQPIVVNGWVVARRGETIVGTVTTAKKAGHIKGVSQLGLELTDVTVVDGQQLPIRTELWKGSAGTSHGADAAGVATSTGVGTIIGAAADGGAGAGIGAGAGALAGIGLVLLTRGKPTVLGAETPLTFRLKEPLSVSTRNSAQAFLPVGPSDYNSAPSLRHRVGGAYPVAYPPYYAACDPDWGCGPYYGYYRPSIGFYGGYYGGYYRGFRHYGFRR